MYPFMPIVYLFALVMYPFVSVMYLMVSVLYFSFPFLPLSENKVQRGDQSRGGKRPKTPEEEAYLKWMNAAPTIYKRNLNAESIASVGWVISKGVLLSCLHNVFRLHESVLVAYCSRYRWHALLATD